MALYLGNSSEVCWLIVCGATATGDDGMGVLQTMHKKYNLCVLTSSGFMGRQFERYELG